MPKVNEVALALDQKPVNTAIATYTGKVFDVCAPETWMENFDLLDISKALSNCCRYQGHVDFYSVAEHAYRVSKVLERKGEDLETQLLGLHHDDAEAYIGDVPSPQKHLMTIWDMTFHDFEAYLERTYLWPWLDIEYTENRWAAVKQADWDVYQQERYKRPAPRLPGNARELQPFAAQAIWLGRHTKLMENRNVQRSR